MGPDEKVSPRRLCLAVLCMLLGSCLSGMLSLGKSHPFEQSSCGLCGLNLLYAGKKKVFICLLLGGRNTFDDNLPCEDSSQAELCMSLMLEIQFCQNLSQKTSSLVDYLKSLGSGPSCLFICLFCCCCFVLVLGK